MEAAADVSTWPSTAADSSSRLATCRSRLGCMMLLAVTLCKERMFEHQGTNTTSVSQWTQMLVGGRKPAPLLLIKLRTSISCCSKKHLQVRGQDATGWFICRVCCSSSGISCASLNIKREPVHHVSDKSINEL